MPASKEYAKRAEKCFRLAAEARSETDRVACLDLAQKWLEAASTSPQDETTPDHIAKAKNQNLNGKRRLRRHNLNLSQDGVSGCGGFFVRES